MTLPSCCFPLPSYRFPLSPLPLPACRCLPMQEAMELVKEIYRVKKMTVTRHKE